ncbi:MAG: hypothetical protein ACYDAC_08160 [Candidatus Dormibacteria bacterium]
MTRRSLREMTALCIAAVALAAAGLGAGVPRAVAASTSAQVGWTTHGPSSGGSDPAVAVAPSSPNTVYAAVQDCAPATPLGPVFKSTDGGSSWMPASAGLPVSCTGPPIYSLAVSPADAGTVYAGAYGGVFVTRNGGASWALATDGLPPTFGEVTLAIDPTSPATIYAGTSSGVFKTSDGAATWMAASAGLPSKASVSALAVDPNFPSTVYAAVASSAYPVYRSADGGATWRSTALTGTAYGYPELVNTLAVGADGTVYAGGKYGSYLPTVERSSDGGASWTRSFPTGPNGAGEVYSLAVSPNSAATVYAGVLDGLYLTTDGGRSWSEADSGMRVCWTVTCSYFQVESIAITPSSPSRVYAATCCSSFASNGQAVGGVYETTDAAASWQPLLQGMPSDTQISALAVVPGDPNAVWAAQAPQGFHDAFSFTVFKSTAGGDMWMPAGNVNGIPPNDWVNAVAVDPANSDVAYAGTEPNGLYQTTDGGSTWTRLDTETGTGLSGFECFALVIDPAQPQTVYAGGVGQDSTTGLYMPSMLKSTDGGRSWTALTGAFGNLRVVALAIDPDIPSTLYAGTADTGVYKSTDGGQTWLASGAGMTSTHVNALAVDPSNPATLFAATTAASSSVPGSLWKSINGGQIWLPTLESAPQVTSVVVDPADDLNVYAAAPGADGVDASSDGGLSWAPLNNGLTNHTVNVLAISPNGGVLYAGTSGSGVWEYALGTGAPAPGVPEAPVTPLLAVAALGAVAGFTRRRCRTPSPPAR